MSSCVDLAYRNFRYRIEGITPTNTTPRKNFLWFDPTRLSAGQSPGMTRSFYVMWAGGGSSGETEDLITRYAEHDFEVSINYSNDYELESVHSIVLQDRHDIIKTLRDDRYYNGVSSTLTTTDTGIMSRYMKSDNLIFNETFWTYKQVWLCLIKESE